MGDIAMRPAEALDPVPIARIHVGSWQSTYAGLLPDEILVNVDCAQHADRWWRYFLGRFRRKYLVYGAESASRGVTAFASAGPSRQTASIYRVEVDTIYLRNDYRGDGIGGQLFAATVVWVQEAWPVGDRKMPKREPVAHFLRAHGRLARRPAHGQRRDVADGRGRLCVWRHVRTRSVRHGVTAGKERTIR